jgi:hypothetical protein
MEVEKLLQSVPGILAFAAGAGCVASWLYAVVNGTRLWFHRKQGASPPNPFWPDPSEVLTERGLIIYRHARYGFIGFFACWLLAILFGVLAANT